MAPLEFIEQSVKSLDTEKTDAASSVYSVRETSPGLPLLIIFSSVNSNGFSFGRAFDELPANVIYIRDPYDFWYNRGISESLNSIDAVRKQLAKDIKRLEPSRTVMLGTSMGGYAALLFGVLLNVNRIIAVSPQTLLDPRLPHTPSSKVEGLYFDLEDTFRRTTGRPSIEVFFGGADMVDAYNAFKVKGQNVRITAVMGADHLVAAQLSRQGVIDEAVNCAINNQPFEFSGETDGRISDTLVRELIVRCVESHYLDGTYSSWRCARALAALVPNWAPPLYIQARIREGTGDLIVAEKYSAGAVKAAPNSVTYADYNAALLCRMGDDKRAIEALENTLRIRPGHYNALCNLAMLRQKSGSAAEAMQALDRAILSRPRLKRAHEMKARFESEDLSAVPAVISFDKNQL